jgi:hypothetical protein
VEREAGVGVVGVTSLLRLRLRFWRGARSLGIVMMRRRRKMIGIEWEGVGLYY